MSSTHWWTFHVLKADAIVDTGSSVQIILFLGQEHVEL